MVDESTSTPRSTPRPDLTATSSGVSDAEPAPIVAVTVFPDRARVTRRRRLALSAGEHRVCLENLPLALHPDSVRVTGRGPASVLGVDVARAHGPVAPDNEVQRLAEALRASQDELAALDDEDTVVAARAEFLAELTRRSSGRLAAALVAGDREPTQVGQIVDAFDAQRRSALATRRDLARRRQEARDWIGAYERMLADRERQRQPDRVRVSVVLAVAAAGEVELDVSYVIDGAGWRCGYDLRLVEQKLEVHWFGLVSQRTGEDWPECDLRLSTARPAATVRIPKLDPWFVDRARPRPGHAVPVRRSAGQVPAQILATDVAGGEIDGIAVGLPAASAAPVTPVVSTMDQGLSSATYQPARVVAVPADGAEYRSTLAVTEFDAELDYVTAPVRGGEAQLRATVVNASGHLFPAGDAALFHDGDYVGTTDLAVWAPGEEIELALGLDDRVRVTRELTRRTSAKAILGGARRREAEHTIAIVNHTPRRVRVTVLDQLPVSRDEGVVVRELRLDPAPTERTELGVLTWVLTIDPGVSREITVGVRVDLARGVELSGWRE